MVRTPAIAASTISPPQPPRIHTSALLFCAVAGPTGGAAIGAGGGAGAGVPAPGPGALPGAGAPQLPQKGPCTWAPHLVQNAISHPPRKGLRYETAPRLASQRQRTRIGCCRTAGGVLTVKESAQLRRF